MAGPTFRNINVSGIGVETGIGPNQGRLRSMLSTRAEAPQLESTRRSLARLTDEAASRLILQTYLEDEGDGALREITTPSRAELVPDMQLRGIAPQPSLNAQSLTYQQSASNIPIFGGRVVVDIDAHDKTLVSINGRVAPMPDISSVASVSQLQAWKNLVNWSGAKNPPNAPETSPLLTWFLDEGQEKWRLVYHFAAVPFAPPDADSDEGHACVRPSFRSNRAYDYFVDAHNGDVAFWFPSAPGLDIPSPMTGMDCFNVQRQFYGLSGQGGFSLVDPLRNIETYDYTYQDIDQNPAPPFPAGPIVNPTSNMAAASPQAVSAHYHAGLVSDFYNNEMKRSGIDNKGMKLVSVVNVYSSDRNPLPSPQWGNAVWFQGKMWYGEENGVSFAKYLDVIAHELTHGVTESSSNLVYRNIPGALNESYSDIFGVIIANWYPSQPNSIGTWNWKIGAGLGQAGGPIRNFADPAAAGQPDHMNQYRPITRDYGGVHIYSGIHNKAIYKLLTATEHGQPVFPTRELALLLYLTLTRLTQMSDFSDSRRTLKNVAGVYYASTTPADLSTKLGAIDAAFDSVGIT